MLERWAKIGCENATVAKNGLSQTERTILTHIIAWVDFLLRLLDEKRANIVPSGEVVLVVGAIAVGELHTSWVYIFTAQLIHQDIIDFT